MALEVFGIVRALGQGRVRLYRVERAHPLSAPLEALTGYDFSPLLDAIGKVLGGGKSLGSSAGGLLGSLLGGSGGFGSILGGVGSILGSVFGGGSGGVGGLFGSVLGGSGGLGSILSIGTSLFGGGGGLGSLLGAAGSLAGSLLPIPGVNVIAAALPLVAGLFADKDYPFAKAAIGASGGSFVSDAFELDGGPLDQISQLGTSVAKTLGQVLDQLGATVSDFADLTAIGYSSGRKSILPKGYFAGIDDTRGANFATGAVFTGLENPEEATLRAVQTGLLRGLQTGAVQGVDDRTAETLTIGLRRSVAADFTSLDAGLADIAFLRDYDRTIERLNSTGDAAALQRLDLRDNAEQQGQQDAEKIRAFLEQAQRLFGPLDQPAPEAAVPAAQAAVPAFETDEGTRVRIDDPNYRIPITDEGTVVGYHEPSYRYPTTDEGRIVRDETTNPAVTDIPVVDDTPVVDDAAAERLAEARAAIDHYVQALLGIDAAVSDTKPLTGYALQLAEAERRPASRPSWLRSPARQRS